MSGISFGRVRTLGWSALLVLAIGMFAAAPAAFAHERRTIANGKYDVVVGWDVEPAFESLKNGASIRISQAGSNPAQPVEGAEKTLKVQLRQGAATQEFPLRAVFGQPGYYVADIVPTRPGDYQFIFVGRIGDDDVNERFDTADGKFNKVEATSAIQFPPGQAAGQPDPAATARDARAAAQTAQTLSYIGIAAGVLGLIAAVAALAMRRNSPAARSA